jgi:UDP-GlcNAc:undecaprenyl-phosphate GlcNAc-1-phosphate transferase
LVALASLGLAASVAGLDGMVPLFIVFIAVIAGFLKFNMRTPWLAKAQIFMGNGGSMFLGFVLAWFLISLSQGQHRAISPVVAVWIFAIPLLDTVCVMLRRIIKGRSPFSPDREHFHHILLVAGYTVNQTVWIIAAIAAVFATVGLGAHYAGVDDRTLLTGILIIFALYFWAMSHAWKVMKVIKREKAVAASAENFNE